MQPLYYLPGIFRDQLVDQNHALDLVTLRSRGLADVFADVRAGEFIATNIERGGPDKKTGCILAYHTTAGKLPELSGYQPDQQTWHCVKDGQLWIGVANDYPPTPEDLRRRKQYAGYTIEINGASYLVPIIRRIDDTTELPRDCYFRDGQLVEPVKESYRGFWETTKEVADWYYANGWANFTKARGLVLAVEAMGINYRIGLQEQNILRIVDVESLLSVLMAVVDVPGAQLLEEAQKKTQ